MCRKLKRERYKHLQLLHGGAFMRSVKFTSWQDDTFFIGFLNEYPDYQTQGMTKEELIDNLKDLLIDIESGQIPYIRKVEELLVA